MRQGTCDGCKRDAPTNELFQIGLRTLCQACTRGVQDPSGGTAHRPDVHRLVDPTICSACNADFGNRELALVGGIPVCEPCAEQLRNRAFPGWLRVSAGLLLLLAAVSLARSSNYLRAEAALVRADRLLAKKDFAGASPELGRVLDAAPDCRKAILLKIKADLLAGNVEEAYAGVERAASMKFEGGLINEVNGLLKRFEEAAAEADQGRALLEQHKEADALPHFEKANKKFPELVGFRLMYLDVVIAVDFDKKDYDGFLRGAEEMATLLPDRPEARAMVASAFAARYAVTGSEFDQVRARDKLDEAQALAKTDEDQLAFTEYRERIEHRLRTREVIDKEEYDRRFRR